MAGRGPAPKPRGTRARRNRDVSPQRIRRVAAPQPKLPAKMPDGSPWPAATRAWWKRWASSPLADSLSALEWEELLIAAVLHGCFWHGDVKAAPELRLRVAKFGTTPEDRLRLRLEVDEDEPEPQPAPRRKLRLVES